jgi:predicted DNA repair protein MutK
VPAALLISAVAPWLVVPLLMLGGLFLCYEGAEKLLHKWLHQSEEQQALREAIADPALDLVAFERDKIRGAVRTDFILSAEIIAITLGTVATASFLNQLVVLSGIALVMTAGVYGLVAGIVKLDDAGLYLSQRASAFARACGRGILRLAPWLMKALSVIGTAAMFMVGGGILSHGLPPVEAVVHHAAQWVAQDAGQLLSALVPTLLNALLGVVAGLLTVPLVSLATGLWRRLRPTTD